MITSGKYGPVAAIAALTEPTITDKNVTAPVVFTGAALEEGGAAEGA